MRKYFGQSIEKSAKIYLLIGLITFGVLTPGLLWFDSQNDVRIWFNKKDPKIQTLNAFEHQFGNDENLVIAVHHPNGLFHSDRIEKLHAITKKTWLIPQVIRVDSLTNFNLTQSLEDEIVIEPFLEESKNWSDEELDQKKQTALNHHTLPGYLISKDAKTALIFARLTPTLEGSPDYERIINHARKIVEEFNHSDGLEVYLSGEATMNNTFREVSNQDMKKILPLLALILCLSLFFIFRSFSAVCLPLFLTLATLTTTLGSAFYLGLKFNSILGILPAIIIAISVADSVHILVSYFQFKAQGKTGKEAAQKSLHKNFTPVTLTSLSTMMGFLSLTLTDLIPIQTLGLLAGLGCLFALFYTLFILCPLLFIFDFKTPKLFLNVFEEREMKTKKDGLRVTKLTNWLFNQRKLIILFFTVLSLGSLYLSSLNTINSNPYSYFSKAVPLKEANDFIKNNFGGNAGPEIMIKSGQVDGIKNPEFLKKVEAFKKWLHGHSFVDRTVDIVDIVKEMNQAIHGGDEKAFRLPDSQNTVAQLLFLYTMSLPEGMSLNNRMGLDYQDMRMSVLWRVQTSAVWGEMVQKIENKGRELGLDLVVTGKTNLFQSMMGHVVNTFFKSVVTASILVCFLMIVLFKSLKIGLISLVPNFIPLLIGGAFMKLAGMNLNIGTTLVASVCLGIAVDDTIHFLSNYYRLTREEGLTQKAAIASIFTYTGSALMITTAILVSAFGLFILGDFTPNVNFGILCAIVLTSALIVDFILLPAMLFLEKRKLD